MNENFKPNLIGFLCNWCSYAGADLAGATKLEIKPYLSVIKVMCSSRINSNLVLTALLWGADGVLVATMKEEITMLEEDLLLSKKLWKF